MTATGRYEYQASFTAAALERICAGMEPECEELIFQTRKGTPWEPNSVRRAWREVRVGSAVQLS